MGESEDLAMSEGQLELGRQVEKLTDRRKQLRRWPLRTLGKARLLQRPVRGRGCILEVLGSLTKPYVQISGGQPSLLSSIS